MAFVQTTEQHRGIAVIVLSLALQRASVSHGFSPVTIDRWRDGMITAPRIVAFVFIIAAVALALGPVLGAWRTQRKSRPT